LGIIVGDRADAEKNQTPLRERTVMVGFEPLGRGNCRLDTMGASALSTARSTASSTCSTPMVRQ
jgi:hypothetical protein